MSSRGLSRLFPARILVVFVVLAPGIATAQTLRTLDFPGASVTYCNAINSQGDDAGFFTANQGLGGFYTRNQKFHIVRVKQPTYVTYAWGIDDNYNVVGFYSGGRGYTSGFEYGPGGFRQLYDAFQSEYSPVFNITPTTGVISGTYMFNSDEGFYYSNGQYYGIDYPGINNTQLTGENDQGQFVGYYYFGWNVYGFVYDGVSVFTDLTYPGAISTIPNRISNSGEIVGTYQLSDQVNHGFTYINGTFASVDFPGATDTQVFGVNTSGVIVGRYTDKAGAIHGFIGTP